LATVAELHQTLRELADLLEERSETIAPQVRASAEEVGRSDAHGARRFVSLAKPLGDMYWAEDEELERRYQALSSHALALAKELLRG
jgi:hypothetical protein